MRKNGLSLEGLIVNAKNGKPVTLNGTNGRTGLFTSKSGTQRYFKNGSLHREDGPAVIKYGKIKVGEVTTYGVVEEEWWIEGSKTRYSKLSRFIEQYSLSNDSENLFRRGELIDMYYRDPAKSENLDYFCRPIYSIVDGATIFCEKTVCKVVYLKDGRKHRIDGPALIEYGVIRKTNGTLVSVIKSEEWFIEGGHHRIDGPAVTTIKSDAVHQAWFVDGKIHRVDGPAAVTTHESGWIEEDWYQNGKRHREDGPAEGDNYYIKGHRYDKAAYDKRRIKGFLKTV